VICLNDIIFESGIAKAKECGHTEFCFDCIERWTREHNSCPICRTTLSEISVVNAIQPVKQLGIILVVNNLFDCYSEFKVMVVSNEVLVSAILKAYQNHNPLEHCGPVFEYGQDLLFYCGPNRETKITEDDTAETLGLTSGATITIRHYIELMIKYPDYRSIKDMEHIRCWWDYPFALLLEYIFNEKGLNKDDCWIILGDTIINNLEEVDEFFMIFDYIFFSGHVIRIIDKNEANSIVKQQQQQQGDEISELQLLSAAVSRIMRDTDGVHYHYLSSKKKIQF
jgi:hypothetical protein